jgi:YVTN family beta-propeller protein
VTATITVGSLPGGQGGGIAITPDGSKVYVVNEGGGTVSVISTTTNAVTATVTVGAGPVSVAITPSGAVAYVASYTANTITPITVATNTAGTTISTSSPNCIAITPDASTAYVCNYTTATVTPINLSTNTAGTPIAVSSQPYTIAVTPDGVTAYAAQWSGAKVTAINVATNTPGATLAGTNFSGIAITPDQAPVASFTVTPALAGSASSFDASASTVTYGTITNYAWIFGDGNTANTSGPTTTHTYTTPGSYTATVTETDSAGTSTTDVFTGQTLSRNGAPSATTTRPATISNTLGWATAPGNATFASTVLNGTDKNITTALPFDVGDGVLIAGWSITLTSTTFSSGGHTLPTTATTIQSAPSNTCDTICTPATNTIGYPYSAPAASTAPAATKLYNAAAASGIGNQTVTPTFRLAAPAKSYAGTYTSTWTVSLISGP